MNYRAMHWLRSWVSLRRVCRNSPWGVESPFKVVHKSSFPQLSVRIHGCVVLSTPLHTFPQLFSTTTPNPIRLFEQFIVVEGLGFFDDWLHPYRTLRDLTSRCGFLHLQSLCMVVTMHNHHDCICTFCVSPGSSWHMCLPWTTLAVFTRIANG